MAFCRQFQFMLASSLILASIVVWNIGGSFNYLSYILPVTSALILFGKVNFPNSEVISKRDRVTSAIATSVSLYGCLILCVTASGILLSRAGNSQVASPFLAISKTLTGGFEVDSSVLKKQ